MAETTAHAINKHLFPEDAAHVFAVLDGASVPDLRMKLFETEPLSECLFRGELAPDMAEVAPYLVELGPGEGFTEWVVENGWGNHWGVFVESESAIRGIRLHLRKFLIVYDPAGKPMHFRYYDPRVLRTFLPTCTESELASFFGPVRTFLAESEDPDVMLRFRLSEGNLVTEKLQLKLN